MLHVHENARRSQKLANTLAEYGQVVAELLGNEEHLRAAEEVNDMLVTIFEYTNEVWNFDRPTDQWSLFCGALSPHIEQHFSNLLMYSGVEYDEEEYPVPVRSDGFVYTEDDRPC